MHKPLTAALLFILLAASAAATPDAYTLNQINATHWHFETTQYDLAEGDYHYQAFANDNSSDYRVLEVDLSYIILPLGWSIIGWTDPTDRTAHYMGGLIGGNCTYVTARNLTTGEYVNHNMGGLEGENNFAIERGWGYYVQTSAETLWDRDY